MDVATAPEAMRSEDNVRNEARNLGTRGRRQIRRSGADALFRVGFSSERELGAQLDVARRQPVAADRAEGGRVQSRIRSGEMRRVEKIERVSSSFFD